MKRIAVALVGLSLASFGSGCCCTHGLFGSSYAPAPTYAAAPAPYYGPATTVAPAVQAPPVYGAPVVTQPCCPCPCQ